MSVLALLSAVVALDQLTKWWAWRYLAGTQINSGGDPFVGHAIGTWYSGPVSGALLDLLDGALLSIAVWVLIRCQVPATVRVPAALMTGGWGSNLLDRLGSHYWTAPGSVRGAVDFIHLGAYYYNLADFCIIVGTPLFLLAAVYQGARAARRPAAPTPYAPAPARSRALARLVIPSLVGAGLISVVVLGAAHYGGVDRASHARRAHWQTWTLLSSRRPMISRGLVRHAGGPRPLSRSWIRQAAPRSLPVRAV